MTPEIVQIIIAVVGSLAGGAGVYAAIKADLTRAIMLAEMAVKDSGSAHVRIDDHINQHHVTRRVSHG